MKKLTYLVLIIMIISLLTACNRPNNDLGKTPEENLEKGEIQLAQLEMPKKGEEIAIIKTNFGDIKIRLFPNIAPKAVENFITHSQNGYYDGVTFHRVIEDFMIQGGDPEGTGRGGQSIWGSPFEDEFHVDYHNIRGAVSMANAGANTNGSQFFIVQKKDVEEDFIQQMEKIGAEGGYPEAVVEAYKKYGGTPWLDYKHTVFGQVFEGMDVVDEIAGVEVGPQDRPLEDVIIETIEIVKYE